MVHGATYLFVEHRGAGSAIMLTRGTVLRELRQLGATKAHCASRPYNAMYHCSNRCLFLMSAKQVCGDIMEDLVSDLKESLLCFTLMGEECLDLPLGHCKRSHGDARLLG